MSTTWKLTQRAVNSKSLFDDVHGFIEEGFNDMGIIWNSDTHRESFLEFIDEWLEEIAKDGRITQWKVFCDFRNNTIVEMEQGQYHIDVSYKQADCLNTTILQYKITTNDLFDLDDLEW